MDETEFDEVRSELVTALDEFLPGHHDLSGSRLYSALQHAARCEVFDHTIQPLARALLDELERFITGPVREQRAEIAAAIRLAAKVRAWLIDQPDFRRFPTVTT